MKNVYILISYKDGFLLLQNDLELCTVKSRVKKMCALRILSIHSACLLNTFYLVLIKSISPPRQLDGFMTY